ncbi:MAG TPA: transcriptional regulator, partial [Coriobacteriia bacterium]|nr:transcriptional regulator [Coriobacteriia bacterium]
DLPFEHDGVRGSHETRDQMHEVFAEELAHSGRRYVEVYGDVQARCDIALTAIERLLSERCS